MEAVWKKWKKYIITVLLVVVQCRFFQKNIVQDTVSVVDYLVYFYRGTLPYTMTGREIPFNIPGIWSFYFMYFFALNSRTVSGMFQISEYQLAVRYRTRKRWFLHQNAILCEETAKYVGVSYAAFFLYGIFAGASGFGVNPAVQMRLGGPDVSGFHPAELAVYTVVLPAAVLLMTAYLQYAVSVGTNAVIGMIVNVALLVSSVFQMHPLLAGNYLMLMRSEKLLPGGTNPFAGMALCAGVMILSVLIGKRVSEKKDLF